MVDDRQAPRLLQVGRDLCQKRVRGQADAARHPFPDVVADRILYLLAEPERVGGVVLVAPWPYRHFVHG